MGATPKMNWSAKGVERSSPQYGGEGVTHSPTAPRCLRTARYGRTMRDLGRTGAVRGWHRDQRAYKRERKGERGGVSSRTAARHLKGGESRTTSGRQAKWLAGRQRTMRVGAR